MPRRTAAVVPAGSLSSIEQPTLSAGDLQLRPWAVADADALLAAFTDPAIQHWHARTIASRQESLDMIASYHQAWRNETAARWAITDPTGLKISQPDAGGSTVVGGVSLRVIDLQEGYAEVAYWVMPAARGRGLAVAAVVAMSAWALDELGLHRLELDHSVANTASCRVARKAGFGYEGTKRSAALHTDGWHDMHLHSRIQADT
jgi:[ribosomal protein S5]-alanine N-acetyltransferase